MGKYTINMDSSRVMIFLHQRRSFCVPKLSSKVWVEIVALCYLFFVIECFLEKYG